MAKQLAMSCVMTMLVTPKRCARLLDEVVDRAARERVEAARRLVVDDDGRVEHERARQADALAHAARELRRELPEDALVEAEDLRASRAPSCGALAAESFVCSTSGNATLSRTVIESRSAAYW